MTSNSRRVTQTISFRTPPPVPANRRLTETYSDGLMDDLFDDVDRILEGDMSTCMTFVNKQKPTGNQPDRWDPDRTAALQLRPNQCRRYLPGNDGREQCSIF